MSIAQGFLDAIREAPEDDTPRRIFADWLEDNGWPDRAAFVRLQLLSAEHETDWYRGEAASEVREARLLRRYVGE
jgi:uncharacterized protein (TIGR02996 family)